MGQACETTEPDSIRQQFPFYNEIQSIFAARMQRMLWSEATEPSTSSKRKHHQFSSDDEEEEEEDIEEPNQEINEELLSLVETHKKETEVITTSTSTNPRKRAKKGKNVVTGTKAETSGSTLKEILEEFMRQTVKMEKEWRDAWETKERERDKRETEWRRRMSELEEERAAAERRWMEREEERRLREEARAQKRDTLIDALLNKINRDNDDDHQGF